MLLGYIAENIEFADLSKFWRGQMTMIKYAAILISLYYIVQKIFYKRYIKLNSKELLWKQRFYSYFVIINGILMDLCFIGALYSLYLNEDNLTITILIINATMLGVDILHWTYVIRSIEGGI